MRSADSQSNICLSVPRRRCVWPWVFYISHLCWLETTRQAALLMSKHFIALSPWYTISEDCLTHIFFTVHFTASKRSTPVHQMQYYNPTPQSPNKTLWCQIDTLVNSTSWIWYCLATAEKPTPLGFFRRSSGWQRGRFGRWRRRGRMEDVLTIMVLYDVGLCLACLQAAEQN